MKTTNPRITLGKLKKSQTSPTKDSAAAAKVRSNNVVLASMENEQEGAKEDPLRVIAQGADEPLRCSATEMRHHKFS